MESPEHERLAIEQYMASQAGDEKVTHLEKVASERVMGHDRDVWDVHTDKERWWVITGPTNLYAQSQFPSMDVALTFHVGLMARVQERTNYHDVADEHAARFAEAWRKLDLANEVLNTAHEPEQFQSVGMHCRESLIAFVRAASENVPLPPELARPKAADVKGWAEVLGNVIAPGDTYKAHRSYLKALADKTWELVSWLTHYANATGHDAYAARQATEHALMSWSNAILVHDVGGPSRCPVCGSYRLYSDYEPSEGLGVIEVLVCEKCGWRANGIYMESPEPEPPSAPPEGECITVEAPLRPPFKQP